MCSIALTYPARSHFQCTLNRERQDKGLDERCRSSGQGEELEDVQEKGRRRQADFKEATCYPSAVVQGFERQKNDLCEGSVRGKWDPQEGKQPFQPNPNGVGDRTTTLRRLLIGVVQFCSLYMYIPEISQFTIQKDRS